MLQPIPRRRASKPLPEDHGEEDCAANDPADADYANSTRLLARVVARRDVFDDPGEGYYQHGFAILGETLRPRSAFQATTFAPRRRSRRRLTIGREPD